MSSVEVEEACIGCFMCSLEMLGSLLGLPESASIRHVEMLPFGMNGTPCVRIVVEDEESIPPVESGQEIVSVSPRFKLGAHTYRQFISWGLHSEPSE